MTERVVTAAANVPRASRTLGFEVAQLHPSLVGGGFGPFLQIDVFALAQPVFKPHPHAGFSAVTYILPESAIGFINRDSLGDRRRIAPGALHWTMAGSGLQHEEVPERLGVAALGLQMFIDLPAVKKNDPPQRLHLDPAEIPLVVLRNGKVRVVVGEFGGAASPIVSPTPNVTLLDVDLGPSGLMEGQFSMDENIAIYILDGEIVAGSDSRTLLRWDLATTSKGDTLRLVAGKRGARVILFGGAPLNQPVLARGPFVFANEPDLQDAMNAYAAGRMGSLGPNSYGADGAPVL